GGPPRPLHGRSLPGALQRPAQRPRGIERRRPARQPAAGRLDQALPERQAPGQAQGQIALRQAEPTPPTRQSQPEGRKVIRRYRQLTRSAIVLGLASALLALFAQGALAAPQIEVTVSHDKEEVSHSDTRVDYTVAVKNVAAANAPTVVGD